MNENYLNSPINLPRQEGAVLIVALILLVVMTMLGISGMEATKLETKMAANVQDYNSAFQNAEGGLAWASESCKQAGVGALSPLDENFVSVPCVSGSDPEIKASTRIRGGIEGRRNGSMNEIPYIVSSVGRSSNDSSDPETIKVTLVGGLLFKTAAADPLTYRQPSSQQQQQQQDECPDDLPENLCKLPEGQQKIEDDNLTNCANEINNISKNLKAGGK